MKILFATSSFNGGGITSYAYEVINNYSLKNEMYVLIGDDKKMPITKKGVTVLRCENSDVSVENAKKALHIINDEIKPDVIISSNSRIMAFIAPYILDSIKLITVSHSQKYIETDTAAFNSRYIDSIVALSNFNKKYIDRRFHIRDNNKAAVVYNFVKELDNANVFIERKKKQKPINIVFMGGSSGSKSPDITFQIMMGLAKTDLSFKMYWLGSNLLTLGKLLPFQHVSSFFEGDTRFVFTGRVPREEALDICARANILLIPSRREGCPMAMLETMRSGVISITSDYKNACQELVLNNQTGKIISHNDILGFVKAITDIIANPSRYDSYYDASYNYFISNLSFSRWKERMDAIINKKTSDHYRRKSSFSLIKFKRDLFVFSLLDFQNRMDKMVNERIRVLIPFVREFYKNRRNKK